MMPIESIFDPGIGVLGATGSWGEKTLLLKLLNCTAGIMNVYLYAYKKKYIYIYIFDSMHMLYNM